jgi:uncharacterized membrane protein YsdA (DUF1294 family)
LEHLMLILGIYAVLINLSSFAIIGYDKRMAKIGGWRVPEKNIFLLAFMGGALGVYLGMIHFRHKTRHLVILYGIMLLIIVNLMAFWFLVNL